MSWFVGLTPIDNDITYTAKDCERQWDW